MTEFFQALLTPLIAIVTTYIAYQQYRIRRDERAMVLYDRRLAVFKSAIGAIDRVRAGNVIGMEDVFSWASSMTEAPFLFGKEIQAVIDPLFGALHDYAAESEPVKNGKPYSPACAEAALAVEALRWPLTEAFSPYLQLPGSPLWGKRRLSVKQVSKLVSDVLPNESATSNADEKDIPF
jgi:hypothetical protein